MNIYLDIETIPGQSPTVRDALSASAALEKADVRAPSNYKDETKIAEYIAAKHAGKMIGSAKVQVEYYALRKESPRIEWLESPNV